MYLPVTCWFDVNLCLVSWSDLFPRVCYPNVAHLFVLLPCLCVLVLSLFQSCLCQTVFLSLMPCVSSVPCFYLYHAICSCYVDYWSYVFTHTCFTWLLLFVCPWTLDYNLLLFWWMKSYSFSNWLPPYGRLTQVGSGWGSLQVDYDFLLWIRVCTLAC